MGPKACRFRIKAEVKSSVRSVACDFGPLYIQHDDFRARDALNLHDERACTSSKVTKQCLNVLKPILACDEQRVILETGIK